MLIKCCNIGYFDRDYSELKAIEKKQIEEKLSAFPLFFLKAKRT